MTILSDGTIHEIVNQTRMIQPYVGWSAVHHHSGLSYGLQPCAYDLRIRGELLLRPGDFRLASSLERVVMPDRICAFVHDKSTWARMGVAVQNTHVDPGFRGHLTIELSNHGQEEHLIIAGTPICQLVFHTLDAPARRPYSGKYQDQPDRPVPALGSHR